MKRSLLLASALLLAGCATYQPLPLATHVHAPDNPANVEVDTSTLSLPPLRHHVFNPRHGLDMTDVAILAVVNNPQLKLARDARGIAHAQAFAARLLPDPVLDLAQGFPTSGPAETSSYSFGISYDFGALLTHSLAVDAASASARAVDLNELWMEWQVAGAARQLFVQSRFETKTLAVLRKETMLLQRHHARLLRAHTQGDVSLTEVDADLANLQAVQTRGNTIQRELLKTRQAMNTLLGLSPHAKLDLTGPATVATVSAADIDHYLAVLPHRRPDLLALVAGYRSADAHYRQAILQQFPAIQLGFTRARDADAISTSGFQISLTLPLFNRNRGHIAIAKATRQKLHDEYSVRLMNAQADVEHILQNQKLLRQQRAELQQSLASTTKTVAEVRAVAQPGDVSETSELRLKVEALNQRLDMLSLDETLLEQDVALQTLLGWAPSHQSQVR